ncbi:MAG: winged helix-turn-helix transcriptional regulator [Candidatus Thorarchaeota archaeon]|jgi:DNA-binding Lrp family transcriptional regulator
MDAIDRSILWQLDANCRSTYESLSRKLGITANAVRKRIANLIDSGVIVRFMVLPSNALMDLEFVSGVLYTHGMENRQETVDALGANPVIHHVSPLVTVRGGAYHFFGQYSGSEMLAQLGTYLRGLPQSEEVRFNTVLYPRGEKVTLTKRQIKILRVLIDDPRMAISEIARRSEIPVRSTRRALQGLEEEGGIRFTVRWDVNTRGNASFWACIGWDEKASSYSDVVDWLHKEFPDAYWTYFVAAEEPTVFARFVVDDLLDASRITDLIKEGPNVESVETLVCYSTSDFPWFGEARLREMLAQADIS